MIRRITCVVFITLIWGASAENEEKIRDMFKNNLTRNDFSNLLNSLVKLNERRVSFLQKLYRLEDYGVLSEVLRSGNENMGNESPSNLFLIVISKNKTHPTLYFGFDGLDLTSLDGSSNTNKTPEKLVHVPKKHEPFKDRAGFIQNIRKVFDKDFPSVYGRNLIDDGIKKINPTKKPLQKSEEKISNFNLPSTPKDSLKPNLRKKVKRISRFEVVNNNDRLNAKQENVKYDDNSNTNPSRFVDNSQSSSEKTLSLPITNNENHKYLLKDKDSAEENYFSSLSKEISIENGPNNQYRKINSANSIRNNHGNFYLSFLHSSLKKNKTKENVQGNQSLELKLNTSIINSQSNKYYRMKTELAQALEDRYSSLRKNISKENVQGNQSFELKLNTSIINNQKNKYYRMKAELARALEDRLNGKLNKDKASEQNNMANIQRLNKRTILNKQITKANTTEPKPLEIINKNATRIKKRIKNISTVSIIPSNTVTVNTVPNIIRIPLNKNLLGNQYPKAVIGNSNTDKPKTAKPYNNLPIEESNPSKHNKHASDPESNDESFEQSHHLRNSYKLRIKRLAGKFCTKSCISAYKNACRWLKCARKAKKAFKRECKKSCYETFAASGSRSSSYSDESVSGSSSGDDIAWYGQHRH